jgi:uncharacterized protein YecE (DUF72 family)
MRKNTPEPSGALFVGTSGWSYPHWRGKFFPEGLPQRRELEFLAAQFQTVEVNGTFYSLARPSACARWRGEVPPGFIFTLKASRYITHMLKLKNCETALANFFASGVLLLGAQLGPLLWQIPPVLRFDFSRAKDFFSLLPRSIAEAERCAKRHDRRTNGRSVLTAPDGRELLLRHALEIRHESWLTTQALTLMSDHEIALVAADSADRHPASLERTSDFAYVRLHGSGE